jgi:hypothetical protein
MPAALLSLTPITLAKCRMLGSGAVAKTERSEHLMQSSPKWTQLEPGCLARVLLLTAPSPELMVIYRAEENL